MVNLIKTLWRKSRFPPKPNKQDYSILKVIDSLRVYFGLEATIALHFHLHTIH